MVRSVSLVFGLLVGGLLPGGQPAVADDAGLDWRPVAAQDSKIRTTLPEAKDHARYFKTQTEDYSANLHLMRVPTSAFRVDQILLLYAELSPGRFFPTTHDVGRVLEWKGLQAGGVRETGRFTVTAGPGVVDVATFTIEGDVACAAFSSTWGSHGSETSGAGSRRLFGYGCEDRGKPLDRARIEQALDSLEIDDD